MARERKRYQKLSGRSLTSHQCSYLSDDHVLIVDGRYVENYRRVRYADIEAILVCPTSAHKVIALIASLLALIFGLWAVSRIGDFGFTVLLISTIFFALVAAILFYGKGSVLFGLQSAVQTVLLDGVSTERKADKAVARLSERIAAVQGDLTPQQLAAVKRQRATAAAVGADRSDQTAHQWAAAGTVATPPPLRKPPHEHTPPPLP